GQTHWTDSGVSPQPSARRPERSSTVILTRAQVTSVVISGPNLRGIRDLIGRKYKSTATGWISVDFAMVDDSMDKRLVLSDGGITRNDAPPDSRRDTRSGRPCPGVSDPSRAPRASRTGPWRPFPGCRSGAVRRPCHPGGGGLRRWPIHWRSGR